MTIRGHLLYKGDTQVIHLCPICQQPISETEAEIGLCVRNLPQKRHRGCGNTFGEVHIYDFETQTKIKQL